MLTLEEISPIEIQAGTENIPELWNKAVLALEERHRTNPDEAETILRLGHIYWFLVFEEGVWNCTLDYRVMEKNLFKLYEHAKIVLKDNVEFLWSFNIMLGIAGYYFIEDYSPYEEDALRINMLKHAAEIAPQDPFVKLQEYQDGLYHYETPIREYCDKAILLIHVEKVFENRGLWGCYFEPSLWRPLGFEGSPEGVEQLNAYIQNLLQSNHIHDKSLI